MAQETTLPLAPQAEPEAQHEIKPTMRMPEKEKIRKVIQSIVLYLGFFSLGLMASIIGPTLLDLQRQTNSSVQSFSFIFTVRAIIALSGAILGGFLVNRVNYWMLLSLMTLISSVSMFLTPYITNLVLLGFCMSIGYWAMFLFNSGGNLVLLKVWKENNGPWMQALHCIYGTGALVGPLLAAPFLQSDQASSSSDSNSTILPENGTNFQEAPKLQQILQNTTLGIAVQNSSVIGGNQTEEVNTIYQSEVHWAFLIVGLCGLLSAVLLLLITLCCSDMKLQCVSKEQKLLSEQENISTDDEKKDKTFRVKLTVLLFFFYFFYCILEMNFGTYLSTYAVKDLGWSEQEGARVTSGYWAAFVIGRVLGIILVKIMAPWMLLTGDLAISTVSLVVLLIFSKHHFSVLWICSIATGFGFSTIFATGITWAEQYIRVSGVLGTVFMVAGSASEMVGPAVIGILLDKLGPKSFLYVLCFAITILVTLFVILQFVARRHGLRLVTREVSFNKSTLKENKDSESLMKEEDKAASSKT